MFITGSRHAVNWWGSGQIKIGCQLKTIAEWLTEYEEVGEDQSYNKDQIAEYLGYIKMCEALQNAVDQAKVSK
uniref:hypothetical protein n=1 Tax=Arachidicoccus terrestris TaxID=2875539 RepID=UPI0037425EB4